MEDKQDVLARTYATLSALRKNIDSERMPYRVPETYAREFHTVLDKIADIGMDVSEFRVPDSEVTPDVRSFNTLTGERRYSREKYVNKPFILTKLDAILSYFEITMSEKPRNIGLRPQDK